MSSDPADRGDAPPPSADDPGLPPRDATAEAFDRLERLMEFPTTLPLKIVGVQNPEFEPQIAAILARVAPGTRLDEVERRPSSGGQYVSLTFMVPVDSRDQLEALHRELVAHPMVKVVL